MLTQTEQRFYEVLPGQVRELAEEISKLRIAVEKCIGHEIMAEAPVKEEHPTDSQFDVLAVTSVQVFPFKDAVNLGHMKGYAQVIINDQLVIRGLRIMDGENGLFVGYPIDPFYKSDDCRSICFPITRQLREHIENCVLEKYMALTE